MERSKNKMKFWPLTETNKFIDPRGSFVTPQKSSIDAEISDSNQIETTCCKGYCPLRSIWKLKTNDHQQPSLTRSTNWIKDWSSSLWTQTRKSVGQSLIERKSLPAAARECRREEAGRSWNWPEMHSLTKNVHILFKHLQGLTKCTGLSRSENLPVELKSDLHHSWSAHQWTVGQPSKNSMFWYKKSNRSPTVSTKPSSPCWTAKD